LRHSDSREQRFNVRGTTPRPLSEGAWVSRATPIPAVVPRQSSVEFS
jgi:hypothetical protein